MTKEISEATNLSLAVIAVPIETAGSNLFTLLKTRNLSSYNALVSGPV